MFLRSVLCTGLALGSIESFASAQSSLAGEGVGTRCGSIVEYSAQVMASIFLQIGSVA